MLLAGFIALNITQKCARNLVSVITTSAFVPGQTVQNSRSRAFAYGLSIGTDIGDLE